MENENPIERVGSWIKNSIMLKLITITILMLLLLIPTTLIKSIINERQRLNDQTIDEVSSKWAKEQDITGPVLTIPIVYEYGDKSKNGNVITETKYWNILPESLDISGTIDPKKLRRGIYEVVVYDSELAFNGVFIGPEIDKTNVKQINYDKAFLTIGISDLRGIKKQIKIKWNKQILTVKPGSRIPDLINSGITVDLPDISGIAKESIDYNFSIDIQGSKNLSFVPVGSTTKAQFSSPWNSPSFNGNFLPDKRDIRENGFSAEWSILQLNRNYPQSWIGKLPRTSQATTPRISTNENSSPLSDSKFGVDLILPLDDYQKSMRSAKYAVMTIALTFLIFFLVEILNKRKIHPFQYALVGLGLCLFYVLLVSISEHSNFNLAYGISTIGIVTMISLYSLSVFKMKRLTYLLVLILIGLYSFLFVTLQLADYALLMGSIGLTIMLALTMYFTRNVNWYKLNIEIE